MINILSNKYIIYKKDKIIKYIKKSNHLLKNMHSGRSSNWSQNQPAPNPDPPFAPITKQF